MGDTSDHPVLPRLRNPALSIDTSQGAASTAPRLGLKLDIRDVVRREGYRADLNTRAAREEFRGNAREEQRNLRRDAFWSHVNTGVAYSWVSDRGLVISDEEMELAFKFYRGGEGIGWLSENSVWSKVSAVPNAPSQSDFIALELFEKDGISWEDLHKMLDDNQLADYDPVREAFALIDGTCTGVMSRAQVKEMASQWGIGEITEEDVDDLFRATGTDPSTQPSITLNEYRDLVQIDLSKKEGVRVKLVDQLAEQPMVIMSQDTKIAFANSSRRGSPTAAGAVSARAASALMQSYTISPSSPTRTPASLSPSRTPAHPFPASSRAVSAPPTPIQFPGLRLDSPTRTASPAQPVFPRSVSPARPNSALSARPSSAQSTRPTSARPPSPSTSSASPPRSTSPTSHASPTLTRSTRPASPGPARIAARPASPSPARKSPPKRSPSPSLPSTRPRSSTLPDKLSTSPPPRSPSPSIPSLQASRKALSKTEKHTVAFSEQDPQEEEKIEKTNSKERDKVERTGSTGSMKLNLALFKAEDLIKKGDTKTPTIAVNPPVPKNYGLQKPKLKDMYNSNKEIDQVYYTSKK